MNIALFDRMMPRSNRLLKFPLNSIRLIKWKLNYSIRRFCGATAAGGVSALQQFLTPKRTLKVRTLKERLKEANIIVSWKEHWLSSDWTLIEETSSFHLKDHGKKQLNPWRSLAENTRFDFLKPIGGFTVSRVLRSQNDLCGLLDLMRGWQFVHLKFCGQRKRLCWKQYHIV